MQQKIIFVDVDGPLSYDTEGRFMIDEITMPYPWVQSECTALAEIIKRTGAKVVISSDWKYHYSIAQLGKIFVHYGIPNKIIGITDGNKNRFDLILEKERAEQIMRWVEGNKDVIDTWVAIDDLKLDGFFEKAKNDNRPIPVSKENFVWLDGHWSGSKAKLSENIDHIVNLLNGEV
jgi:hypothetical protein